MAGHHGREEDMWNMAVPEGPVCVFCFVHRSVFYYPPYEISLGAQGSTSRVTLEGKDTGDFAWSLSNTTKRMTLVLSGRGRVAKRGGGGGVASTVSLRQSFRFF